MPTQLNYVKGEWLDREEELLLRRAELLSEKKDLVTPKVDFAARMSAGPPPSVHSKSAAVGSQVPKDLVTAADGLLCLGGGNAGLQQPADVHVKQIVDEKSSTAAASKKITKKRQLSSKEADDDDDPSPKKKKKSYIKLCSVEGCAKLVQSKGVCIGHGAKLKRCSSDGCPNRAVKGGVCKRHGAVVERKKCNAEDCTNLAVKAGMCLKHGSKNRSSEPKKTPASKKGGKVKEPLLCKPVTPGTQPKVKRCNIEGCNRQAKQGGVCVKHGAKCGSSKCSHENCPKYAQRGGVCIEHGAVFVRKRCSVEGCENGVKKRGLCRRHGAYAGDTPPK
eukprot:scaffold86_cov98-Skeletonema_dohrnii-CCMP3373.AAC.8